MNKIKNIDVLRFLDGVVQYYTPKNRMWKYFVNSVDNRTSGFLLALSDIGKYMRINSSSNVIVTIPNLPFPIGASIVFEQAGEGTITVVSSVNTVNGGPVTSGQYKCIQLIKVEESVWTVIGGEDVV